MQKHPIINENIGKNDRNLYENMMKVVTFINDYEYYLNIDEKILLEVKQIANSLNIILRGSLKADTKKKDIDNKNKEAEKAKKKLKSKKTEESKDPSDRCLVILECAKVEKLKDEIQNFDEKLAKQKGCTETKISDIQRKSPGILELIEELQVSFVSAINGETKIEKVKKIEEAIQVDTQVEEANVEIIKSENAEQVINKSETPIIEEAKVEEDPNLFYKNFTSKNIEEIKNFYQLCKENNKNNFFPSFIDKIWEDKGNAYLKLQIIEFLIDLNLDKENIRKTLFIGLASQVNMNNDIEYRLFDKISSSLNPPKATNKAVHSQNPEAKQEIKAEVKPGDIETAIIRKDIYPELSNAQILEISNGLSIENKEISTLKLIKKFLNEANYKALISNLYHVNDKKRRFLDKEEYRHVLYTILSENLENVGKLYKHILGLKNYEKHKSIIGIIFKVCSIEGDYSIFIKDFYTFNETEQINIIFKILKSEVYSNYLDLLTEFYPKLLRMGSSPEKDYMLKLYENKVLDKKLGDTISPEETITPILEENIIIPEEAIPVVVSEIVEEETAIIPQTEDIISAETIEEKKVGIERDELINFIQNIGDNGETNNSFISENVFKFEELEKTIIFRQVRDKINILIDELDYNKLYFLLELSEKIELNLDLKGLRRKFLKLTLDVTKTEKNTKIFQKFLDKYIINN